MTGPEVLDMILDLLILLGLTMLVAPMFYQPRYCPACERRVAKLWPLTLCWDCQKGDA